MNSIVSIQLDKDSDSPLYLQLSHHIEELIVMGNVKDGEKLPPIRKMAEHLNVNNVTVVNAYNWLEKKGYVISKKGSGFFVTRVKSDMNTYPLNIPMDEAPFSDEDIDLMSRGHFTLTVNSINFASATPSSDLFPVEDFKQVLNEVLDRDMGDAFGYHEINGYRDLRISVSEFLRKHYNIESNSDQIQIISGAQQGIDVIAKAMIQPGDYIFVENPTYAGAIGVFKSRGAKIIGIPIESDGINMDLLEKYINLYKPKLIYTMPNYQNPTTYCYSNEKKEYLLNLASRNNIFIIEDDFLSDLNFGYKNAHQTLKSIDNNNKVLYIKSFSKVLMPGLRTGFLIAPEEVFGDILQAKHTTDISSSGFIQRAFDLYLRKGIWGKHLEYMRNIFKNRYGSVLQEASELQNLGVKFYQPGGGLNLWLTLPDGITGTQLYYECAKYELLLVPGKIFYVNNAAGCDSNVRISFAAVNAEQIKNGMEILYHCIQKLVGKQERKMTYSPFI